MMEAMLEVNQADRVRWTTTDLELMPEDGKRYEIIEGDLHVTTQPHWYHQRVIGKLFSVLDAWSEKTRHGQVSQAPGVIFDEENAVAPDVVWASHERLEILLDDAGHLRGTPELVVEVLSPGLRNEERDRSAKLKLYSTRGILEYWIANWRFKTIEVYRREGGALRLAMTLLAEDELSSPLLPGFSAQVGDLFK